MATTEIPTFTDTGNYLISIELDGTVYVLLFLYNARDRHWYLDIESEDGAKLRTGIKLVTGFPLIWDWRAQDRPPGELIMIDPSGAGREAGYAAIGRDVFLTYLDQAGVSELYA